MTKKSLEQLLDEAKSAMENVQLSLENLRPDEEWASDNDFSEPLCFVETLLDKCQALMARSDEIVDGDYA